MLATIHLLVMQNHFKLNALARPPLQTFHFPHLHDPLSVP